MAVELDADRFEEFLDARFARMKQEMTLVLADIRSGAEPAARLSRRNFVLLLYSYWEAIVKESVKDYICLVESLALHYSQLCPALCLAHHRKRFSKQTRSLRSAELTSSFEAYRGFCDRLALGDKPDLYDDKLFGADSNLSSKVLERILLWSGLPLPTLELPGQDPRQMASKKISPIAHRVEYHYSWETVSKFLDLFLYARNQLGHSALNDPPNFELCQFYNMFIGGLLDWFANSLRDAVDQELWKLP